MNPVRPPVQTTRFVAPKGMDESQVSSIDVYHTTVKGGTLDGSVMVVTAWKPTPEELEALNKGGNVYLSSIGGLFPHFISTSFKVATYGECED